MTPSFESWRAAEPPAGFADRTTDAILRERGRRTVRPRRPWFLLAAAACLLVGVGGVAWGWTLHQAREKEDERGGVVSVEHEHEHEPRVLPVPVVGSALAEAPHEAHVKARVATRPLPSASSPPSPKVPLPLCVCNAFACDCGPE
jgi:hypothetical protein